MKWLSLVLTLGLVVSVMGLAVNKDPYIINGDVGIENWECSKSNRNNPGYLTLLPKTIDKAFGRNVEDWHYGREIPWNYGIDEENGLYPHHINVKKISGFYSTSGLNSLCYDPIDGNKLVEVGSAPIAEWINGERWESKPGDFRVLISSVPFKFKKGGDDYIRYAFCGVATHYWVKGQGSTYQMCKKLAPLQLESPEQINLS
ncbi:hypothetical protein BDV93DRAFT_541714 [Ceratobasidium sp. AG-I]|nr:hypothetical protein BDV93DRAFT_541714 [Ceratobasidium sp. AG-I]